MLQKIVFGLSFITCLCCHAYAAPISAQINDEPNHSDYDQCTVGLYQGPASNFAAITKSGRNYNYTFRDNTNGNVHPSSLITGCNPKEITMKGGDTWPLMPILQKDTDFVSEGVILRGRLLQPIDSNQQTPLVVYTHGSESSGWIDNAKDPYLLVARGVSVFVYDKRGTGLSGGQYTQNFPLLAKDLVAASTEAKALATGKYGRFGLIGLSQGGWIAPLASDPAKADFIAIGYGLVVDIREEDASQVEKELLDAGFGEIELAKAKRLTDATALIAASGYKRGLDELDQARNAYLNEPWFKYVKGGYTGTFLQKSTKDLKENGIPFYDSLNIDWSLNPMDVLQNVDVPQLWALAEEDREAPITLTLERLAQLQKKGKPINIYVFPNTDHGMWEYRVDANGKRQHTRVTEGFYELFADWAKNKELTKYGMAVTP